MTFALIAGLSTWLAVDEDDVKPGWIALVVVLALCVASVFLWRSMNSQLHRIDFDETEEPPGPGPSGRSGRADRAGSADEADSPEAPPTS